MLLKTKIKQLCKVKKDIEKMNPCKMPETYKVYPYYLDDHCKNNNFLDNIISRLSILNISINAYNESINACQRSLEIVNAFKAKLSMLKAKIGGITAALCVQFDILLEQICHIKKEMCEIIHHIEKSNPGNKDINCMHYEERKYFYIKDNSFHIIYYDLIDNKLVSTRYDAIPTIATFKLILNTINNNKITDNDTAYALFMIIEQQFSEGSELNTIIEQVANLLETLCNAKDELDKIRKKQIAKFEEWKEKTIDSIENQISVLTSCDCDC